MTFVSVNKFFWQANSSMDSIGVDRIFDWGREKPQIICNDVTKIFQKRNFLWGKDIVESKIRRRDLFVDTYQVFALGRSLIFIK